MQMASLKGILTRIVRQFKLTYVLHNILHPSKLQHNRKLYKKYGVKRSIYQSLGNQNFKDQAKDIPWLDRPNAIESLKNHPQYASFSPVIQQQLNQFVTDGYMIIPGFFSTEEVEQANKDIDTLLQSNKVGFHYTGRKIMQSYKHSPVINDTFFRRKELTDLLSFIMGKPVIPFQTINFLQGSEQRAHSDSIHMTTQPLGYLIACWIALENITDQNGPVVYYPGSHTLPYLMTPDYNSGNTSLTIGAQSNTRYEDTIDELIREKNLQPSVFHAQPGDLLIWHANLLHGGSAIHQKGATRKSLVAHYFCEDVICYHEISQRPALFDAEISQKLTQK